MRPLRGVALPAVLLIAWAVASHSGWADPRILPSPEKVVQTAIDQLLNQGLMTNLVASLARDMAGFVLGTILGLLIGAALGLSHIADRLFAPNFDGLRQIPILAWVPLISLWFGVGEMAKIVFVLAAALIPVVLNTHEGVRSASPQLIEVGRSLTLTRWQMLSRLYVPAALPSIATGVHLALIYAWVASVGAEYFMTVGPGIGGLIIAGRERFQMDLVMLGIVILGLVGFLINRGASVLEMRLLRWRAP